MSELTLEERVTNIEWRLGMRWLPKSDPWQWCKCTGCTRGAYEQKPACIVCAGYDPRTGEEIMP